MKLVFEKAASEEVFCPLYAKLLSELSEDYPVLLTEMANLYSQYMEIFEEVPEHQTETYQEMCKRNVEKKYRRGYSQFLAELIKHNVVDQDTFMKIITTIIRQVEVNLSNKESTKLIEELADCFMKIVKAIRVQDRSEEDTLHVIRQILKNEFSERIKPFTASQSGLSNKARFTFLDIYESIQL
jgi:NCAIR mutase (PurE)-related protein